MGRFAWGYREKSVRHYTPLVEAARRAVRADGPHVPASAAVSPLRTLAKKKLRPDNKWFDQKKDFVTPPKKPTFTPAPSAKGRGAAGAPAPVAGTKGGRGGAGRMFRGAVQMFGGAEPFYPLLQPMVLFAYRKPEYL